MIIEETLRQLKRNGKKGLIVYITAGDPNLYVTEALVCAIAKAGADIIELGIPFSDPLADGVTIQQARIREKTSIPLALMTYYNPVYAFGLERFVRESKSIGVNGFIIPDLPLEESEEFQKITDKAGLELISFLTPVSTPERISTIIKKARGFIYCVSVLGVTGVRKDFSSEISNMLEKIKDHTDKPLAIGFGISNPEQAQEAAKYADAVIVGSAIVKLIENYQENLPTLLQQVTNFVKSLKEGLISREHLKMEFLK